LGIESNNSNNPDVKSSYQTKLTVRCVDGVELLEKFDKDDTIVLKVDIEGSEYDLFVHLIVRKVIDLIDYLAIEYHGNKFKTTKGGEELILDKIFTSSNIKLLKWY
jgi:FkbM family methyltransferase